MAGTTFQNKIKYIYIIVVARKRTVGRCVGLHWTESNVLGKTMPQDNDMIGVHIIVALHSTLIYVIEKLPTQKERAHCHHLEHSDHHKNARLYLTRERPLSGTLSYEAVTTLLYWSTNPLLNNWRNLKRIIKILQLI